MKWFVIVLVLLLGIGIGIEYQKSKPIRHSTIFMRVGVLGQKALLNPQVDDVIVWRNNALVTKQPQWILDHSPCDPKSPNECHILARADKKKFAYKCPADAACDPEVPIGSDIGVRPPITLATAPPPHPIYIACDVAHNNAVTVDQPSASVSKVQEAAADWVGLDEVAKWTVSGWKDAGGNSVMVCNEVAINQDNPTCTLADGAVVGQSYTYQISGTTCSPPNATFTLRVIQ